MKFQVLRKEETHQKLSCFFFKPLSHEISMWCGWGAADCDPQVVSLQSHSASNYDLGQEQSKCN